MRYDLTLPDQVNEVFIDGITQMNIGIPITKLVCHTVTSPAIKPGDVEQRQANLTLTIPTLALYQFLHGLLGNLVTDEGKKQLLTGADVINKSLITAIENFSANPSSIKKSN